MLEEHEFAHSELDTVREPVELRQKDRGVKSAILYSVGVKSIIKNQVTTAKPKPLREAFLLKYVLLLRHFGSCFHPLV